MERILVTGALGQLGTELVKKLQNSFGMEDIFATDINLPKDYNFEGNFSILNVLDKASIKKFLVQNSITQIYHLAAILSAKAEHSPSMAWRINMDGLINVLDLAKSHKISKIFWPSSIAVFGPDSPKGNTPQNTILNPDTIYGITKVAGEKLCAYYNEKFDLDIRSLRYPGLIGHNSLPGGGTTDYAVEIFHEALKTGTFTSPIGVDTKLPMMFMPDAVRATLELMEAERNDLSVKDSYNLDGISFSPEELAKSIQKIIPEFSINYNPDFRQLIAASWPNSIDDSKARNDWKWKVAYDLDSMTKEMISHLRIKELAISEY